MCSLSHSLSITIHTPIESKIRKQEVLFASYMLLHFGTHGSGHFSTAFFLSLPYCAPSSNISPRMPPSSWQCFYYPWHYCQAAPTNQPTPTNHPSIGQMGRTKARTIRLALLGTRVCVLRLVHPQPTQPTHHGRTINGDDDGDDNADAGALDVDGSGSSCFVTRQPCCAIL